MAISHVAGIVVLMLQKELGLTTSELKLYLRLLLFRYRPGVRTLLAQT
jgi:hypothetical protein